MPSVSEAAIDAIGGSSAADTDLAPRTHAAALPPAAGPLRRVLERAELDEIIGCYETADAQALSAQASFFRWSRRGFFCRFLSILFGTTALLQIGGILDKNVMSLGLGLQYSLIAASLLVTLWLAAAQPFERWMRARAAAETARLDLFNRVLWASEKELADELPLLPLQLEYFRRYQLDAQRFYYHNRALRHARAAGQSKYWHTSALVLTGFALFPATVGFVGAFAGLQMPGLLQQMAKLALDDSGRIGMLAVGIIASGLGDLAAALSLVRLDRRNAARYAANAKNLDFLAERYLAEARAAAAAGDSAPVRDFVDLAQGIIASEHREWLLLQDVATEMNLDRLARLRVPGRRTLRQAARP